MRRQTYGYLPSHGASPLFGRYFNYTAWRTEAHVCEHLPKVLTWQRTGRESNLQPQGYEFGTLIPPHCSKPLFCNWRHFENSGLTDWLIRLVRAIVTKIKLHTVPDLTRIRALLSVAVCCCCLFAELMGVDWWWSLNDWCMRSYCSLCISESPVSADTALYCIVSSALWHSWRKQNISRSVL